MISDYSHRRHADTRKNHGALTNWNTRRNIRLRVNNRRRPHPTIAHSFAYSLTILWPPDGNYIVASINRRYLFNRPNLLDTSMSKSFIVNIPISNDPRH